MRFLVDVMLGRLAVYLRMCGHDAAYALDRGVEDDGRLLELARAEDRTLVTRDKPLAAAADDALLLTAHDVEEQLRELRDAGVDVTIAARPVRCGRCNAPVERLPADATTPDYAPSPAEVAVWRCVACGQCFWRGSHWDDVAARLRSL